jgi:hypothetical protein
MTLTIVHEQAFRMERTYLIRHIETSWSALCIEHLNQEQVSIVPD